MELLFLTWGIVPRNDEVTQWNKLDKIVSAFYPHHRIYCSTHWVTLIWASCALCRMWSKPPIVRLPCVMTATRPANSTTNWRLFDQITARRPPWGNTGKVSISRTLSRHRNFHYKYANNQMATNFGTRHLTSAKCCGDNFTIICTADTPRPADALAPHIAFISAIRQMKFLSF